MNKSRACASIIISFVFLLLSPAFLGGCGSVLVTPAESLDYQNSPARMKISGDISGIRFSGTLEILFPDGDTNGEMRLTYSEPEALKGVSVTRIGDLWGAELDGVTLTGTAAERLGVPCLCFSLSGNVTYVGEEDLPGSRNGKATVISVTSADGLRARVTVSHDGEKEKGKEKATPVSVSAVLADGRVVTVTVEEYSGLPQETEETR